MRLATFDVQTVPGKFERLGALAHGTVVDLNAACAAYFATSQSESAARRQAAALVPLDMIAFLEGGHAVGSIGREMAEMSIAHVAEKLKAEAQPLGLDGQRLTYNESEIRWLAPVPRPPMIRDGILLLDHHKVGMERLFKINHEALIPEAARSMPIYWKPSRAAVAGHKMPIRWPGYSEKPDYEFVAGYLQRQTWQKHSGGRQARGIHRACESASRSVSCHHA